jgi:hypothetical protein
MDADEPISEDEGPAPDAGPSGEATRCAPLGQGTLSGRMAECLRAPTARRAGSPL